MIEMEKVYKAAGNKSRLATALGLTRQALTVWKRVPAVHLAAVARITGIPARELRPDLAQAFQEPAE